MSRPAHNATFVALFIILAAFPSQLFSQYLPEPSGKSYTGVQRFEWTDSTRIEPLAGTNTRRRIVVDVWYPARKIKKNTLAYLDTVAISKAFGNQGLELFVGPQATKLIKSGIVKTHTYPDAPFDERLKSAPVIFFSHGMGMITQLYTTQIEDLVSHGYIVASILHPHDAWLVPFADGTNIRFETKFRNASGHSENDRINYENKRIEVWAADIRFALNQLERIKKQKNQSIPFATHMNLGNVGAFGHSSGGRAAARACQLDSRIKSCANLDGVVMMQPFYLQPNGVGMAQPFLMFERVNNIAPDAADAESLGMSLTELNQLVDSLRKKKKAALSATGGCYQVLLHFDSSNHMSFSDLPLLQAKGKSDIIKAKRLLHVTCSYVRDFFQKTLRGKYSILYDQRKKLQYIKEINFFSNHIK